ncbi:MAG: dihydrofolate reductase [Omnitrophica WOR_2 bacterium]
MIVSLLVAMDEKGGIGLKGRLPWHLSADLKRFKQLTMGHAILMGRKTYESIGRNLPGRISIVITRNHGYAAEDALVAHSIPEALEIARQRGESEAFIIGGGDIFNQSLSLADRIYLTRVHTATEADTFFPSLVSQEWQEERVSSQEADERNDYPSTFSILERKRKELE